MTDSLNRYLASSDDNEVVYRRWDAQGLTEGFYMAFNANQERVLFFKLKETRGVLNIWGLSLYNRTVAYRTLGLPWDTWLRSQEGDLVVVPDIDRTGWPLPGTDKPRGTVAAERPQPPVPTTSIGSNGLVLAADYAALAVSSVPDKEGWVPSDSFRGAVIGALRPEMERIFYDPEAGLPEHRLVQVLVRPTWKRAKGPENMEPAFAWYVEGWAAFEVYIATLRHAPDGRVTLSGLRRVS
jgi:hypothetical protein